MAKFLPILVLLVVIAASAGGCVSALEEGEYYVPMEGQEKELGISGVQGRRLMLGTQSRTCAACMCCKYGTDPKSCNTNMCCYDVVCGNDGKCTSTPKTCGCDKTCS